MAFFIADLDDAILDRFKRVAGGMRMDITFLQTLTRPAAYPAMRASTRPPRSRPSGHRRRLRTDTIGNLIAVRRGTGRSPAGDGGCHMDESGSW